MKLLLTMSNGDIIQFKSRYDSLLKCYMEIKSLRVIEYEKALYSVDSIVKIEAES